MRPIRPDRVAIYVRWSTDDQTEGTTLDVQLDGCRHYALSQGWAPSDALTFVDDGYSGSTLDRPALTRLRQQVNAGQVDCVVVFKVDRLSRNIVNAVDLVLGEWRDCCAFKSAREPIDTATDLGRVIFSILAMFADFERSQIRERTQAGKVRRIAEGRQLHGEPAFGYRHSGTPGQWVEEPHEAALVRRIFNLAAGGQSAAAICRGLNGEGSRTRAGKAWSLRSVLWILRNRLYVGEAVYGRTQVRVRREPGGRERTERIARAEPLVSVATRAAPPLIDDGLFARAGEALQRHRSVRRAVGPRGAASPYLLVGLARCRCGSPVVARRRARGGGWAYRCSGAKRGLCALNPGQVDGPTVEAALRAQFLALHGDAAVRSDRLQAVAAGEQAELTALRRKRQRLAEREQHVLQAVADGRLAVGELGPLRETLQAERERLTERIRALEELESPVNAPGQFSGLPAADQRELIRAALASPPVLYRPRDTAEASLEAVWAIPARR